MLRISLKTPDVTAVEKENIDVRSLVLTDANHHFGGTRMATTAQNGVVNPFQDVRSFKYIHSRYFDTSSFIIPASNSYERGIGFESRRGNF